jgi:hypothetical protein
MHDEALSYLAAELEHATSMWQHFNDRIDKEVQYYFLMIGFAVTFVGVLLQIKVNSLALVLTVQGVALLAGVAGYRLLRHIVMLTGTTALYATQVALTRRGFLSIEPEMQRFAILNDARDKRTAHFFQPISRQLAVRLLTLANAAFFASFFPLSVWAVYAAAPWLLPFDSWKLIFAGASASGVLVAIGTIFFPKRLVVTYGDRYLDHITRSAYQALASPSTNNNESYSI